MYGCVCVCCTVRICTVHAYSGGRADWSGAARCDGDGSNGRAKRARVAAINYCIYSGLLHAYTRTQRLGAAVAVGRARTDASTSGILAAFGARAHLHVRALSTRQILSAPHRPKSAPILYIYVRGGERTSRACVRVCAHGRRGGVRDAALRILKCVRVWALRIIMVGQVYGTSVKR